MRKFQLAIFDWNGTLLNDVEVAYEAVIAIFESYGLTPPSLEIYKKDLDSENIMKFYYDHGIPTAATLDDLNLIYRPTIAAHIHEARLASHAYLVLDQCQRLGMKIAIVSATNQELLEQQVDAVGIKEKFDCLRGGAWKKEPVLLALLEEYKIDPQNAFYVDDTFDCLRAAKRAGLYTIGYTRGYNSFEKVVAAKPNCVIDSFFDLMEVIENGSDE